jgi:hypothetical protein
MSHQATEWAIKLELSPTLKLLLMCLAHHANKEGLDSYPGMAKLEKETGLSNRTIQKNITVLCELGLISSLNGRVGGRGNRSSYQLHFDSSGPETPNSTPQNPETGATKTPKLAQENPETDATNPETDDTKPRNSQHRINRNRTVKEQSYNSQREQAAWKPPQEFSGAFKILWEIPGCVPEPHRDESLTEFWLENEITPEMALSAATALCAEWPGPKNKPYKDARLTVRNWSLNRKQWAAERSNGARASPKGSAARPEISTDGPNFTFADKKIDGSSI